MTEAVIVATARTPIGRANKGSLTQVRPDDMSAFILADVLSKVPGLDPADVEDVIWGIGQPGGEGGYNIARVASVLAGVNAPGVTVNRYCSSSLQAIRMAAHAIKAGEGDCFVTGGVETVSRYGNGAADTGPHNDSFSSAEVRTQPAPAPGPTTGRPPRGCPTSTSPWARPPRTWPSTRASPGRPRTSGGSCPRTGPRPPATGACSSGRSPRTRGPTARW